MMNKNKTIIGKTVTLFIMMFIVYSCANIGRPEGGPKDFTPPLFVGSSPKVNALNYDKQKIELEFDEYIKLEKPSEKVVISPPQLQMPEISANGKKIKIKLLDSLKANTTYSINFSDAIVDNNEGNPLGNFSFTFSTGDRIDTMEVSGVVLNAKDLEPIKGMFVGLHQNLSDSAFTTLPFDRIGTTDSRGHFAISGVAPKSYHIFALKDVDRNYIYNQKAEEIAFCLDTIIPRMEKRMRMDTVWVDSLTYDTIVAKEYMHYLPDSIVLRAFKLENTTQYLIKEERLIPQKIALYFAAPMDTLPLIKGLNFDEQDAFIVQASEKRDTINYWIKDSLVYKKDTLSLALTYQYTDTLDQLLPRTDTLHFVPKQKVLYKFMQQEKKKKKKKDDKEEKEDTHFLPIKANVPSKMDIYDYISFTFEEPIAHFDTAAIQLSQLVDTIYKPVSFEIRQDSLNLCQFNLFYNWTPAAKYELSVDSLAFQGLYGLSTDKIKKNFEVHSEDDYFTLTFNVQGASPHAFIELLNAKDEVVRRRRVKDSSATFYFLTPGKYGARLIDDINNNGKWDTGAYDDLQQPEAVYYYPEMLEYKALWNATQNWNVKVVPLDKQKPNELKKQKPDEKKKPNQTRKY